MTTSVADAEDDAASLRRALAAAQAENAMLRETLDAIDATVSVYDHELRYLFANQGYHALFPHLPEDAKLVGRSFEDVLALSIAAGAVADPQAASDPAGFMARRRREMDDRDRGVRETYHPGHDRWSQVRVQWTPRGNRVALRIDITAIKRLQQELLRAQRMETIGRIAGGVAHDFNNLLTVIISNLEIIRLKPSDVARVEKLTASAMGAAESGAALIRQLLTFARRDMTRPKLLSPNTLLLGMEDLLRRTAGRDIAFALMLDAEAGEALVDLGQFESAMINLVLNAREAIGAAKGRIVVTTRRTAEEMLAVDVTDTGCGMTPEVAAQAFEPFFTTKPVGTGPGLGLSQVYGFVEGAGGRVMIDSTPGAGTTMTLMLVR